jgi:uncharacterized protein
MTVANPNDGSHLIRDESALRALFPPTHDIAAVKALPRLDRHASDFIARAPFLCIGTQGPDGQADVSPRGDAPGFVRLLDDQTLAIPDRPGNNRLDTMVNIVGNPSVGLLFMIPGFDDTLRVNGRAVLSRDPDLLALMAVEGRLPRLAIVVTVVEHFLHCAKAFRRSRLWDPVARQDRAGMPSLVQILLDQTTGAPQEPAEIARLEEGLEEAYRTSMY